MTKGLDMHHLLKIIIFATMANAYGAHVAKIDSDKYLNAIEKVDTSKKYFLVGQSPSCFKYQNQKVEKKLTEFDICKPGFASEQKSKKMIDSFQSKLPLALVLEGCDYEILKVNKTFDKKKLRNLNKSKNLIFERTVETENGEVSAYLAIHGSLDESVLKMPVGALRSQFIVKINNKVIVNKKTVCCDPKKDRNQCEFYRGECLAKMNGFDFIIKKKSDNSLLVVDSPSGFEGFHFRLSELSSTGIKEKLNKSVYGVGGCKK